MEDSKNRNRVRVRAEGGQTGGWPTEEEERRGSKQEEMWRDGQKGRERFDTTKSQEQTTFH